MSGTSSRSKVFPPGKDEGLDMRARGGKPLNAAAAVANEGEDRARKNAILKETGRPAGDTGE